MSKEMFFGKPQYMTRGISDRLPFQLMAYLWEYIRELGNEVELDYLQVFSFSSEGNKLVIKHSQEVPPAEKLYELDMSPGFPVPDEKIFVIDDEDHATMLWASEY